MAALLNGCALIDAAGDTATNQPGDGPSGDTAGPTWVPHRTGIASIGNCQTAAHGTDLFAMSGNTQSTVSEEYSSAADSWSMIMPIPTAVANATATTVGDKIYVLGGILANSNCTDAVQIYDTITNSWTSHQAGGYCRHGAAAIGTTIWVTGGASGSICPFNATAEMFSNCVTKPVPAPTTRQFASVVAIDPTST